MEVLGLCHDITDKTVVIVEDVVDSGSTIAKLKEDLMKRNPKRFWSAPSCLNQMLTGKQLP